MSDSICVNFGRPMPLFPLPGVVLLPHAVQPLHVFERRYRQMVQECLDGSGQMAMASFAGEAWKQDYEGMPPLRQAVCIGQIVQHVPLGQGQQDILLQGVCRARIVEVQEPEGKRLYRTAKLMPLEPVDRDPPAMDATRSKLRELLSDTQVKRLRGADKLIEWFDHENVPTHALLELVGFTLLPDYELRYKLLAEASPSRRAGIISHELLALDRLIRLADLQAFRTWPKGMSWN
jgi:uncharacterized protein